MRITALAGGIGGARFLRGLKYHTHQAGIDAEITVIGNTGDDIWMHGLRVCPDLDTVMYTLGGGISEERGWGREGETFVVKAELQAYGIKSNWFGLGDQDLATHLIRTQMLKTGYPLSDVTAALCERWQPGVTLLPMTNDRAETHVVVDIGDSMRRAVHFQEWWIKHQARIPALEFITVGGDEAKPAPGVLDAIAHADVIVLPPSNPVVSIGTILGIAGIRDAIANASANVIGLSPIVSNAPVRGMADKCLPVLGVPVTAEGVALHYGAEILDGWLVDTSDESSVAAIEAAGIACRAVPLMMRDVDASAAMAAEALALAESLAT